MFVVLVAIAVVAIGVPFANVSAIKRRESSHSSTTFSPMNCDKLRSAPIFAVCPGLLYLTRSDLRCRLCVLYDENSDNHTKRTACTERVGDRDFVVWPLRVVSDIYESHFRFFSSIGSRRHAAPC
jgi:hypothetical protein